MADLQHAFASALKLHQDLEVLNAQSSKLGAAMELSDELARELGRLWPDETEDGAELRL